LSTILVTGAAGFIGSHVVEALLRRGEAVVGLDCFDPFYPEPIKRRNLTAALQSERFTLIDGDVRDRALLQRLFAERQPDRVIHLAARAGVRPSIEGPLTYVEHNVTGTASLLDAATADRARLRHFVFASSSSVYGDTLDAPFREEQRTDWPASPYSATKKAGEVLCYTYHHLTGVPITCLRFFTVYGPRQRPDLAIHKFTGLIEAGEPVPLFGDGDSSRDYTYVDDTVAGILAALDRPAGYEIYNLGRGQPIALLDMVRQIETALGRAARIEWRPRQPGEVTTTYADISRARDALGYDPCVEFDEGVRRFVAWWRATPRDD